MRHFTTLSAIVLAAIFSVATAGCQPRTSQAFKPTPPADEQQAAQPQHANDDEASTQPATGGDDVLQPAKMKGVPEQILRRTGYIASYNNATGCPNWVAWKLTADHCDGPAARKGMRFQADDEVDGKKATPSDYKHSGYDRGHMCPAADNHWSYKALRETFLMSNICPQNNNLNIGDWNELENACRRWAVSKGDLYIVCGPVWIGKKHKTIGENEIYVPEAFFKVILCLNGKPQGLGFIYRNERTNKSREAYLNTIDQVERITGIDFFPALPDETENKVEAEANLDAWDISGPSFSH